MRVLHVVGSFHPASRYGGPIESNRQLCSALASLGVEVLVLTTDSDGPGRLPPPWRKWVEQDGYRVHYARRWLRPDIAPGLWLKSRTEIPRADVVHATGCFNWFLPGVAQTSSKKCVPLVLSPRGSLYREALNQKKFKKRLYSRFGHEAALRRVTAFHATSDTEKQAIHDIIGPARVEVVPNGVVVPPTSSETSPDTPFILFMGRLHPYKKIERIIRSFGRAAGGHPEWSLLIAGGGSKAYEGHLAGLIEECQLKDRVGLIGFVEGSKKSELLARAGFLVYAPQPENFGNVVSEALAHGTPCVAAKTVPWQGLADHRCGLWVDSTEDALGDGLSRMMSLSIEERRAMGERGREWMIRELSWDSIAKRMLTVYEGLADESKAKAARC